MTNGAPKPIVVDWRKFLYPVILSVVMAVGSSVLTSVVWQAKMELRVDRLEKDSSEIEDIEDAIDDLTLSVEKNNVLEKYKVDALLARVDRLDDRCCD